MLKTVVLIALMMLPLPLAAQTASVQDQIVSQLRDQGFTSIDITRTLLGRVHVRAKSDRLERELVFNPTTGEILRDYWEERSGKDGRRRGPQVLDPGDDDNDRSARAGRSDDSGGRSGSGAGNASSDRNDDRSGSRDKSDDDDEDKSGRSGNSGKGNSNDDKDDDSEDDD